MLFADKSIAKERWLFLPTAGFAAHNKCLLAKRTQHAPIQIFKD